MSELVAPVFVTPQRSQHRPPTVSIVATGRPLSEGIRLLHNTERYGFILNKDIEGFGLSPVENTTVESARGGSTLRHRRWGEGDMFLPVTLASPSPEGMHDMFARLVEVVTNQNDYFDVVFFDPYSQEARRRTALYDSGLEMVNEVSPTLHRVGVTGTFLSPFWRGPERVVTERIAPPVKPLITADPGTPVNRWDDPEFADSTSYEPWFVVDGGLEKQGTGGEHGRFVAGHRVSVNPGETVSVSADLSFVDGPNVGDIQVRVRSYDADNVLVPGSTQTVISESYAGSYTGTYVVPETGAEIELGFYTGADVHANTRVRIEGLDVKRGIQYLARYEWEGEPHASPSIKRDHTGNIVAWNPLSGVDREFDNFWRQPTPPPAGTSYEWAGERHASESIKRVDGEEVARSVQVVDPQLIEAGQGLRLDFPIPEGADTYMWRAEFRSTEIREGYDEAGLHATFTGPDVTRGLAARFPADGEWQEYGRTYTIDPEATTGHIRFNKSSLTSPWYEIRHLQVAFYTDAGWPEYWDGDSPSDRANDLWYNTDGVPREWVDGQGWTVLNDPGFGPVPEGFMSLPIEVGFDGDTPAKVDEGSREGAYSFPFFPVFLADSTVQGEHELRVEGDAPVWPVWEIQGPGRDVEIIGPDGARIFVEGEVTSPITIVTEPGKRSIRDASGLIWERMKPGDDQFFALEPGEQTVRITMVGGNPESTIKAVYAENWKTPRGTAQAMIGGG